LAKGVNGLWTQTANLFLASVFTVTGVPSSNLVINGGAQYGDLTGWQEARGTGFRTSDSTNLVHPPFRGNHAFWAGARGPAGPLQQELVQDVDVSKEAPTIDQGRATVRFRAAGRSGAIEDPGSGSGFISSDDASVALDFMDTRGRPIARYWSGVLRPSNKWIVIEKERRVPAGTRVIRVRLIAERSEGISTDAFFDDIELRIGRVAGGLQAWVWMVAGLAIVVLATRFWDTQREAVRQVEDSISRIG
jgi:hypothetical protein